MHFLYSKITYHLMHTFTVKGKLFLLLFLLPFYTYGQTITSISPASGPVGSLLTLTGTGLTDITSASIGGTAAVVANESGTTAQLLVMPGTTTGTVSVTTAGGTASSTASFTMATPPANATRQLGADIDGEAADDSSGRSVSMSADGRTMAIGAFRNDGNGTDAGHVRVFRNNGSGWVQLGGDIDGEAAGDWSGHSVSLSADGQTLAIGAYQNDGNGMSAGHVRVYRNNGSGWVQLGGDIDGEAAGDQSGFSVSLSADGQTVAIGANGNDGTASNAGHVRVYRYSGSGWMLLGVDIDGEGASDESGHSVSLSADGRTMAIGAFRNDGNGTDAGHVRVYRYNGSGWAKVGADIDGEAAGDWSGHSVSLSADGQTLAIGAYQNDGNGMSAGHVRVYSYSGSGWAKVGADIDGEAANDWSGRSVSLSADGQTVAIGASSNDGNGTNAGHVRVYRNSGSGWAQVGVDIDGEAVGDVSGISVSLSADGQTVAIGAIFNDENGTDAGHVRVYELYDATPTITSISPASGPVGSLLTLTGTNLNNITSASIGGTAAVVANESGTTAQLLVMPGTTTGTVSITTAGGTVTSTASFTVAMPPANATRQLGADIDGEAADDDSGYSVSISADGHTVAIGARSNDDFGSNAGHVRVYRYNGSGWMQLGLDIDGEATGDQSGYSVGLSADGQTVAIGARSNSGTANVTGHVRVYRYNGSGWMQLGLDIDGEAAGDESGYSVGLSADGQTVAIGARLNSGTASAAGHVRVYRYNGSGWVQLGGDIDGEAASDLSGVSVSLSADGQTVAIGANANDGTAYAAGHVRVYRYDGSGWAQLGVDIDGEAADDQSGRSVSLSADGQTVAIGARSNDDTASDAGHVRVYRYNGSGWAQLGGDIDGEAAGDESGDLVSLSADGQTVAIGAIFNDGNGTNAGHVRVYRYSGTSWVQLGADIDGEAGGDESGRSVSLSADGRTVAIGAPFNDGTGADAGHVRVYELYKNFSLTSFTPTANALAVSRSADLSFTFDEPLDAATATAATVVVVGEQSGPKSGSYTVDGSTLTFNPDENFAPGETVKVSLTNGLRSTTSSELAPQVFSFTTATAVAPATFPLAENTISTSADGAYSVYAADLDGDGDQDILSASFNDDKVAWYRNNGSGGFGTEQVISTSVDAAASIYAADLDGDGHQDIVIASQYNDKIIWYRNEGSGGFSPEQVISASADVAASVFAADLDGDGDQDVLSASQFDDKIAWYRNNGSGGFSTEQIISTSADVAVSVYAADLDGDGDQDVLSASVDDNKIAWYRNNGSGGFTEQPAISTSAAGAYSVYAADLDGDGDQDVLSASFGDNIAWYRNNGSGSFTEQTAISTSANGPYSVYAADIDGDGDQDVLSASFNDDKIAWYRNNGSGGFSTEQVISTSAAGAFSVYAADLDGDGDQDVLSASFNDNTIAWYRNEVAVQATDVTVAESDNGTATTATVAVSLAQALTTTTTLDYTTIAGTATAGTDFTATSGSLGFAPGEVTKQVVVQILDDRLAEASENFTLQFNNINGAGAGTISATATVTITEDADAGFTLSTNVLSISETGNTTASFTVVLNAQPANSVVLSVTNPDATEFSLSTTSLSFSSVNWDVPQTVTVTGTDDRAVDGNQSVLLDLSINTALTDAAFNAVPSQQVTVTIEDTDTSPAIAAQGFSVSAAATVGTTVGTITADDADGDAVSFNLVSGNTGNAFALSNTGELSVNNPTAFDNTGSFNLLIQATDGTNATTATVVVTVNYNTNAPVFTSDDAFAAAENQTAAAQLTATDADPNSTLRFSLEPDYDGALFSINSITGALSFRTAPDFEQPIGITGGNAYLVNATVSDGQNQATQRVAIVVQNVNEAPVINTTTAIELPLGAPRNTLIGQVNATDPEGDELRFRMLSQANPFWVDQNGFIYITDPNAIDFSSGSSYTLEVEAYENNRSRGLTDSATITITPAQLLSAAPAEVQLQLYPNPASTSLTLGSEAFAGQRATLKVVNAAGAVVNVPSSKTASGYTLNISALPSGLYLLQVQLNEQVLRKRFVKE